MAGTPRNDTKKADDVRLPYTVEVTSHAQFDPHASTPAVGCRSLLEAKKLADAADPPRRSPPEH